MTIKSITICGLFFTIIVAATTNTTVADPVLPATPYNYSVLNLPAHFTTNSGGPLPTSINGLDNTPVSNPVTDAGATLGRVLFYDVNLSSNRTVSCASCHKQNAGFSDPSVLSVGFAGGTTRRHSMTLINARYYQRGRAFWDERAATIEEQVIQPFQDATEMGLTLTSLLQRINEQSYYPTLFANAFGDNTVTSDRVSKALAQFVRSIVSYSSKYDVGRAQVATPGANFPNFTAAENAGKQLFFATIPNGGGACFGCHTTESFNSANPGPQNNGLDAASTTDLGAGEVFTQNAIFVGRFKTTSLRNIELTAPFMHDGRFQTLEQVVEHYNSGIKAHPTLSPALTDANNAPIRLNFTATQKANLVAFLKTLTDNSIATEAKWSNPFPVVAPVELLNFTGKFVDNKVILAWQTAQEINNEFFTIERSMDGVNWSTIGQLKSIGNNTKSVNNYTFNDVNLMSDKQYYRLKQTDFNKRFTYSKIIAVQLNGFNNLPKITIFPNPTTHQITIELSNLSLNNTTELQLINELGQVVFTKNKLINYSETINLSAFPNGQYVVLIKSNGQLISRKLVKI
jgi:cytochrome c peroxidase